MLLTRQALYQLRKSYPTRARCYRVTTGSPNYAEFTQTQTYEEGEVVGLFFDQRQKIAFNYDIAYLRAHSNFTFGGLYATYDAVFVLVKTDLPSFELRLDDYIEVNGTTYNIKQIVEVEGIAFQYSLTVYSGEQHSRSVYAYARSFAKLTGDANAST